MNHENENSDFTTMWKFPRSDYEKTTLRPLINEILALMWDSYPQKYDTILVVGHCTEHYN